MSTVRQCWSHQEPMFLIRELYPFVIDCDYISSTGRSMLGDRLLLSFSILFLFILNSNIASSGDNTGSNNKQNQILHNFSFRKENGGQDTRCNLQGIDWYELPTKLWWELMESNHPSPKALGLQPSPLSLRYKLPLKFELLNTIIYGQRCFHIYVF